MKRLNSTHNNNNNDKFNKVLKMNKCMGHLFLSLSVFSCISFGLVPLFVLNNVQFHQLFITPSSLLIKDAFLKCIADHLQLSFFSNSPLIIKWMLKIRPPFFPSYSWQNDKTNLEIYLFDTLSILPTSLLWNGRVRKTQLANTFWHFTDSIIETTLSSIVLPLLSFPSTFYFNVKCRNTRSVLYLDNYSGTHEKPNIMDPMWWNKC